jgi:hypothetical protein
MVGSLGDDDLASGPDVAGSTAADRRRPARVKNVSPDLIPLLRDPSGVEIPGENPPGADKVQDALGAAKGIAFGLLLVIPFWCFVALGIWWVFG